MSTTELINAYSNIIETLKGSLLIMRESLEDTHNIHYTTLADNIMIQKTNSPKVGFRLVHSTCR